jgi:hypothetical protein
MLDLSSETVELNVRNRTYKPPGWYPKTQSPQSNQPNSARRVGVLQGGNPHRKSAA